MSEEFRELFKLVNDEFDAAASERGEEFSADKKLKVMAEILKAIDLTGKKYGKLIVLRKSDKKGKNSYWICRLRLFLQKTELLTFSVIKSSSLLCSLRTTVLPMV